jgi:hypothetical protein
MPPCLVCSPCVGCGYRWWWEWEYETDQKTLLSGGGVVSSTICIGGIVKNVNRKPKLAAFLEERDEIVKGGSDPLQSPAAVGAF